MFINRDENQEIIDIVVPPELHLMIVDLMFAENKEVSEQMAKKCNVQRDEKTKKLVFNGNSCRELLKHVDFLRSISSIETLKYVDTFSKFNLVVDSCLSLQLIDDFEKHINNFRLSYLQLGISVTPKAHSVFFHIKYFCNKHKKGLGYFSEQAMEAVHSDFKNT